MSTAFETICTKIGCKNEEHGGFPSHEKTSDLWSEWLKKGGLEEESLAEAKELRICYRHFKHEHLGVSGSGESTYLYLKQPDAAVPELYPWDKKDHDDQIFQYDVAKRFDSTIKSKSSKKSPPTRKAEKQGAKLQGNKRKAESDKSSEMEPKVKKAKSTVNKPRKHLDYNALLQTASTIEKNVMGVHRLVPFAPLSHGTNLLTGQETDHSMCEIREALLRHDWNLALKLLPTLFLKRHGLQFIWRSYLQIFCHHPNSSPELLQQLLGTCFNTMNIPSDQLKKVFCIPQQPVEETEEKVEEKFRMCPLVYRRASVIHKLEQKYIPGKTKNGNS